MQKPVGPVLDLDPRNPSCPIRHNGGGKAAPGSCQAQPYPKTDLRARLIKTTHSISCCASQHRPPEMSVNTNVQNLCAALTTGLAFFKAELFFLITAAFTVSTDHCDHFEGSSSPHIRLSIALATLSAHAQMPLHVGSTVCKGLPQCQLEKQSSHTARASLRHGICTASCCSHPNQTSLENEVSTKHKGHTQIRNCSKISQWLLLHCCAAHIGNCKDKLLSNSLPYMDYGV